MCVVIGLSLALLTYFLDKVVFHDNRTDILPVLVDDDDMVKMKHIDILSLRGGSPMRMNYPIVRGFILPVMAAQRRRTTPKSASEKMPPLILLVPSMRFTKMTGTSLSLKPSL